MPDSSADRAPTDAARVLVAEGNAVNQRVMTAAPPEAEAPAGPLVDEARMRAFRDEYPDIVDQLVDLFLTSAPALLDELRDAADSGDDAELQRAAHTLKGSCQNIGAIFMAALCRSIETGEGDLQATVAELAAALEPTESAIRRALAERTAGVDEPSPPLADRTVGVDEPSPRLADPQSSP